MCDFFVFGSAIAAAARPLGESPIPADEPAAALRSRRDPVVSRAPRCR